MAKRYLSLCLVLASVAAEAKSALEEILFQNQIPNYSISQNGKVRCPTDKHHTLQTDLTGNTSTCRIVSSGDTLTSVGYENKTSIIYRPGKGIQTDSSRIVSINPDHSIAFAAVCFRSNCAVATPEFCKSLGMRDPRIPEKVQYGERCCANIGERPQDIDNLRKQITTLTQQHSEELSTILAKSSDRKGIIAKPFNNPLPNGLHPKSHYLIDLVYLCDKLVPLPATPIFDSKPTPAAAAL